ncbi:hypothetical protein E2C01_055829 [Portunus trituberculatus]|uniref:Uncharacterized protein n=1 Tax=Portunus trituberculatus TaxID=210409 RepID=A0A5B7GVT5_PORTR|nr:hypothetical protein [Portunus trituberculatus]
MVLELKDLTYDKQLKDMGLPTLQDRREQGDLITMYKIVNSIEKIDKKDLVLVTEEDGRTSGHVGDKSWDISAVLKVREEEGVCLTHVMQLLLQCV